MDLQVCRVCLRSDAKIYNIEEYGLKSYYMNVLALKIHNMELDKLPKYVCYECAKLLYKFNDFKNKAFDTQKILKLLAKTNKEPLTYECLNKINREVLCFITPLKIINLPSVDIAPSEPAEHSFRDENYDLKNAEDLVDTLKLEQSDEVMEIDEIQTIEDNDRLIDNYNTENIEHTDIKIEKTRIQETENNVMMIDTGQNVEDNDTVIKTNIQNMYDNDTEIEQSKIENGDNNDVVDIGNGQEIVNEQENVDNRRLIVIEDKNIKKRNQIKRRYTNLEIETNINQFIHLLQKEEIKSRKSVVMEQMAKAKQNEDIIIKQTEQQNAQKDPKSFKLNVENETNFRTEGQAQQPPELKFMPNQVGNFSTPVPKHGAESDIDNSETSEDELYDYISRNRSDRISLNSSKTSLENLNIMSDNDDQDAISSNVNSCTQDLSPSIKSKGPLDTPLSLSQPVLSLESISTSDPLSVTPLVTIPKSLVPSPSTMFTSKRPKLVVTKKKVIIPKKLSPKWSYQKFAGTAQVEDFKWLPKDELSPIEYFKLFFSDDIISMIVHQTNLYRTQTKCTSNDITEGDVRDFLAINLLMGIVQMPAYTDYWCQKFRYEKVADIMNVKKFQLLKRSIHFNDNLFDDGDKFVKIRPLLERIRKNCLKIEEETRFTIDEMVVSYNGIRTCSRQNYIENKRKKLEIKMYVRAGVSGIVYDFLLHSGEDTFRYHNFSNEEEGMDFEAKVVLALATSIQKPACKVLCFANFFTSIELLKYLRNEYGIFSIGTIRSDRLRGAQDKLATDENLKKKGRGSHSQVVCNENNIVICKWYDKKCITVASSYVDSYPIKTVLRYGTDRQLLQVQCPLIVKAYDKNKSGVDFADNLVALYRTQIRGHGWYLPIFSQMLDICVNNAWLLYRRNMGESSNVMSLKIFRREIYRGLLNFERPVPSSDNYLPVVKKTASVPPADIIRYDQVGHIPSFTSRGRCKHCVKGQTKYHCPKCQIRLCLVEDRNCFLAYHTK